MVGSTITLTLLIVTSSKGIYNLWACINSFNSPILAFNSLDLKRK